MAKLYKQITTNGVYVKHYPLVVICFLLQSAAYLSTMGQGHSLNHPRGDNEEDEIGRAHV